MELNLKSLTVDDSGRVSFSGLQSGIDFRGAVDAMIAVKRIPIDSLETKVTENADKITALKDLRSAMNGVKDTLSKLYGAITFQSTEDIFANKQAFASTSRRDGETPAAANNLIGVSVTNQAALGSHTVEVLQTAAAHKISSNSFAATNTDLGLVAGNTFTIDNTIDGTPVSKTITIYSGMTLLDLRDAINGANSGTTPSGVNASIVSVSPTEHYLIMTNEETGVTMAVADVLGTPLQTLGFVDGGAAIKNELQAARIARFYADGLLDQTNTIYESAFQTASTVQAGSAGTLRFTRDSDAFLFGDVAYLLTDDLATLATKITAVHADITATVVDDGTGKRLEISGVAGFSMAETGGGAVLTKLGIDNKRLEFQRNSNTISDAFAGVTMSLFQSEPGTVIKMDIDPDLSAVKTQIVNFVTAYNDLKILINGHRTIDTLTGQAADDSGALFTSRALRDVDSALSNIVGNSTPGVNNAFSVFAQIGLGFVANGTLDDPLEKDTLVINETTLDEALLNNTDDVRRLFTFDFSSSDSRIRLLSFDGNTTYNAAGYTLNIANPSGPGATANIDGLADGSDDTSATITNDSTIFVNSGGAQGLRLFYSGLPGDTAGIVLDFTVGAGARMFFEISKLLDPATGIVETEMDTLSDQNELSNERIEEMLVRLDIKRRDLLDRFIRMETSLATANRILESIRQTTEAIFSSR